MKMKNLILTLLIVVLLAVLGYDRSRLNARSHPEAKLAVVSISRILEQSKKHSNWQEKMEKQENEYYADLQKLNKEIEALKADIDTRKPGSEDHLRLMRKAMEKSGALEARKKFYENEVSMKVRLWTEKIYQEVLDLIAEIAKSKDLNIVLARDEVDLPAPNTNELMLLIRTNKVLFNGDELDITDEVIEKLDIDQ